MEENESAAIVDLVVFCCEILDLRPLVGETLCAVEGDADLSREVVFGKGDDTQTFFFLLIDHLMGDGEVASLGILRLETEAVDGVDERLCAAIEDRDFGTVELYLAVVDPTGAEGGHEVLDCGDGLLVVARQDGAALCERDTRGDGRDLWLPVEVNALEAESVVGRRRVY